MKSNKQSQLTLMQAVINAVPTPIFYKDDQGKYLGCNDAFEQYIGLSREQLIGKSVLELFDHDLAKVYHQADIDLFNSKATQIYEAKVEYADGALHDVMFHKAYFNAEQSNVQGIVGAMLDISERKQIEEKLEKLALTDNLTGLDNRYSLIKSLERCLLRQKRQRFIIAFAMLDLDGFKEVNDNYGHPIGDQLLIAVADKLKRCLRGSDVIARFGGDEFSILLEKIMSVKNVELIANKILDEFTKPVLIAQHQFTIGVSIGISVSSLGCSADKMIKNADAALYQVKSRDKGGFKVSLVN